MLPFKKLGGVVVVIACKLSELLFASEKDTSVGVEAEGVSNCNLVIYFTPTQTNLKELKTQITSETVFFFFC